MPPDPHLHEFTMIQRAIRATAAKGMYDEAQRLLTKLLEIAPDNTNYSRTKWRFAAEARETPGGQHKRAGSAHNPTTAATASNTAPLTTSEGVAVGRAKGDLH